MEWQMELLVHAARDELIETTLEPIPQPMCLQRYRRNAHSSPLLRLPTELILEIFERTAGPDNDPSDDVDRYHALSSLEDNPKDLLALTAVCHELRNIGIATPHLWRTVDLTIPPLAELFLERCDYNPSTLILSQSVRKKGLFRLLKATEAIRLQLEGRSLNNLRSLLFEGAPSQFELNIVPILQRATNLSSLELHNTTFPGCPLPWNPSTPFPYLSVLYLYGFLVDWSFPLLRNLTQLIMDRGMAGPFPERTPVETFLSVLRNCPDLERLELRRAGPHLSIGQRDDRDVVQLPRLQELFAEFSDVSTVGCILSHIGYPESASVDVCASIRPNASISETILQFFPRDNTDTFRRFHKAETLTICVQDQAYELATGDSIVRVIDLGLRGPHELSRSASKTLEVVGNDVIFLSITTLFADLDSGMWEVFLCGLPRLERISYQRRGEGGNQDAVDPFILAFFLSFEGEPICPELRRLGLPRGVLAQISSATSLKRLLMERAARGRRLKWLELSDHRTEECDRLLLESFLDVVDEIL